MAKPDHSLDPLILASARREFLEKGFEKASLKRICENANVTTGALYKRYSGKEELFAAVVADTVADLDEIVAQKSVTDFSQVPDEAVVKAWDLEERHDGFVLLLSRAENTRYANFQHDWVEKMTRSTYGYYWEARRRELTTVDMSEAEIHILLSAFWATIYEPFIHGYNLEQLESHCKLVCKLFDWYRVFGFPSP